MGYRKTKIAVVDSKTGYNDAALIYKTFHKELTSYDKGLFQRFLPRDIASSSVLDIGAGDGRMYKYFQDKNVRYVAMDIAEKLLKRGPSRVEKVVADIEGPWPFADGEFNAVICFFVLLHVSDLQHMFAEAYRVLPEGGKFIILHNYQRRSYEFEANGATYKIQDRSHSDAEILEAAHEAFFSDEQIALSEDDAPIGMLYCFTK